MLILASQSPTRKALLAGAGLRFEVQAPQTDERAVEAEALKGGADARQVAQLLAEAKVRAIAGLQPEAVIIAADQTLALGYELLHKPQSFDAAVDQLNRLRGKTHRLHAAVTVAVDGAIAWTHVETAELTMRDFTDAERDEVLSLEGDAVLASVGGYRLEGPSIRLFEAIRGDYFTILGLPLLPLLSALRQFAPETFTSAAFQ